MAERRARILLVEDEAVIAITVEDMLQELGCTLAATAATLPAALAAVESQTFDLALLDINLQGVESLEVARRLRALGRPFVFTTGYGAAGPGPEFAGTPLLAKPYAMSDLAAAVDAALGR